MSLNYIIFFLHMSKQLTVLKGRFAWEILRNEVNILLLSDCDSNQTITTV